MGTHVNDRLVRRYRRPDGRVISQGKRVGKGCPLTREEIRFYVKRGTLATVCHIRNSRNMPWSDAYALLNRARY